MVKELNKSYYETIYLGEIDLVLYMLESAAPAWKHKNRVNPVSNSTKTKISDGCGNEKRSDIRCEIIPALRPSLIKESAAATNPPAKAICQALEVRGPMIQPSPLAISAGTHQGKNQIVGNKMAIPKKIIIYSPVEDE
jgi:hypothetical protein